MISFRTEKHQFIIDHCREKKVLDIGCVNHTLEATTRPEWLHGKLREVAKSLVGLDYEETIVKKLQDKGWNIIVSDAQNFNITKKYPLGFDVIVVSDVIEHLVNPGAFLSCVRKHLAPGGILLLTTPHAYGLAFFLEVVLLGEENINDDHTMTFSRKNIYWLLEKCGLQVKEFYWLIQDSSKSQTGLWEKLQRRMLFFLQYLVAKVRVEFSKEMIVIAMDKPTKK
ncbi:class I SAM-dependent methyltransferase [Candidatus Daviesbacteria bacterium]|nr:class I SAM-dependent methyltransferase [Candidatus Daviesbacteria bacterium]